ncbi:MAG: mechanosensitive ion channel [Flavobacteriales bacterium]|nr:mechanosensitive ion channel [Flavobacteriales bacterium]
MKEFNDMLNTEIISLGKFIITGWSIVYITFTIIITKLILELTKKLIKNYSVKKKKDEKRFYSIYKIIGYLFWVIALVLCLEFIGLKITFLLASGAALLVGVGLGLQNVFNDFVSGVIILIEGTVEIDDIVEVDGLVGKVKKITLRTTHVLTRHDYEIIIPNHKLIGENVVNWSDHNNLVRFSVKVGVAYGSDTRMVKTLLVESAKEHGLIADHPEPFVRFQDFGNSSLDFELFFWSHELFRIENLQSDLRFVIDQKFRENQITIPFPQRDLHIKSGLKD